MLSARSADVQSGDVDVDSDGWEKYDPAAFGVAVMVEPIGRSTAAAASSRADSSAAAAAASNPQPAAPATKITTHKDALAKRATNRVRSPSPSSASVLSPSPPAASSSAAAAAVSYSVRCRVCLHPSDPHSMAVHPFSTRSTNNFPYMSQIRVCPSCHDLISGNTDDDLPELTCFICMTGDPTDDMYTCDACRTAFCLRCIIANYGLDAGRDAKHRHSGRESDLWICFACEERSPAHRYQRHSGQVPKFRKHIAITDLAGEFSLLSPDSVFNPFTLNHLVPGHTYHTLLHPAARDLLRSSPDGQPVKIDDLAPDIEIQSLHFPDVYSISASTMVITRTLQLTQPAIPVTLPIELERPVPTVKKLLRIVSTCFYRFDEYLGVHGDRQSGNRHPGRYFFGLLVFIRNFRRRFPASERWVLRIYYDQSLSLPCPCADCCERRARGEKDRYELPAAWAKLVAFLKTIDFVQLHYFNWPAYQNSPPSCADLEDLSGFHLGHLGMMARFLALGDLGHTAELVVLADLDSMWEAKMKEQLDTMMRNKSSCLRFEDPGYHIYLWGGGSAYAYHPEVSHPLTFPGIEAMIHEFASWHMANPTGLKDHPIMQLHDSEASLVQIFKGKMRAVRDELTALGLVGPTWTDQQCYDEYLRHQANNGRQNANGDGDGDGDAAEQAPPAPIGKSNSSHNRRKEKKQTNSVSCDASADHEATLDESPKYFAYSSDQAFLHYFVWPVIQMYEAEVSLLRPTSFERQHPNFSFMHVIPVRLPDKNKDGLMELSFRPTHKNAEAQLIKKYHAEQETTQQPYESIILPYTEKFIQYELGQAWRENGFQPLNRIMAPSVKVLMSRTDSSPSPPPSVSPVPCDARSAKRPRSRSRNSSVRPPAPSASPAPHSAIPRSKRKVVAPSEKKTIHAKSLRVDPISLPPEPSPPPDRQEEGSDAESNEDWMADVALIEAACSHNAHAQAMPPSPPPAPSCSDLSSLPPVMLELSDSDEGDPDEEDDSSPEPSPTNKRQKVSHVVADDDDRGDSDSDQACMTDVDVDPPSDRVVLPAALPVPPYSPPKPVSTFLTRVRSVDEHEHKSAVNPRSTRVVIPQPQPHATQAAKQMIQTIRTIEIERSTPPEPDTTQVAQAPAPEESANPSDAGVNKADVANSGAIEAHPPSPRVAHPDPILIDDDDADIDHAGPIVGGQPDLAAQRAAILAPLHDGDPTFLQLVDYFADNPLVASYWLDVGKPGDDFFGSCRLLSSTPAVLRSLLKDVNDAYQTWNGLVFKNIHALAIQLYAKLQR